MSTVGYCDLLGGLPSLGAEALDLLDDIHPLHDLAEDHVLPVQPGGLGCADEELRVVGVGAGVGHGEDPRPGVLQTEVLVSELLAVDGAAASSVVVCEVPGLTVRWRSPLRAQSQGVLRPALFIALERHISCHNKTAKGT